MCTCLGDIHNKKLIFYLKLLIIGWIMCFLENWKNSNKYILYIFLTAYTKLNFSKETLKLVMYTW